MERPVREIFERQRSAFAADPWPSVDVRRERLRTLERLILVRRRDIADALDADFGGRSAQESMLLDVFATLSLVRYAIARVGRWMRPHRRHVEPWLQPATGFVLYQPKGVAGIIGPWNYPFYLTFGPLCAALIAGNRVLVKPSEVTGHSAALMQEMLAGSFADDLVATLTGGSEVAQSLAALPLDHLFFTGSARVARSILHAAADNLTPVTLELGGKSPLIIGPDYAPERAAKRIVVGKLFNAGQTCVAPDYILVQAARQKELVQAIIAEAKRQYPAASENPDYTSIVNEQHRARLNELLADAHARGATVVEIEPGSGTASGLRMAPVLVLDTREGMRIVHEEIFGPVLPIIPYEGLDDALAYVNARPHPLALFYFDDDRRRALAVVRRTISGGAAINEASVHVLAADLPFGGIGASGMGAYHGESGFTTFSHAKAVYARGRINPGNLLAPPYGKTFERIVRFLTGS